VGAGENVTGRVKNIFRVQSASTGSGGHLASYPMGAGKNVTGWNVKLTTTSMLTYLLKEIIRKYFELVLDVIRCYCLPTLTVLYGQSAQRHILISFLFHFIMHCIEKCLKKGYAYGL
jgi:hypothetical protein